MKSEPGHQFLESGFAETLSVVTRGTVGDAEAGENFRAIAGTLGNEIARVLDSLNRCEWIVDRWARHPLRGFCKTALIDGQETWVRTMCRDMALSSERWGGYLQESGELGAYRLKQDNSKPPLYRMVLELRPPWQAYVNRCVAASMELVEAYRGRGLAIPTLEGEASAGWESALRKRESHIGRGAFIAVLESGLDETAIARLLCAGAR